MVWEGPRATLSSPSVSISATSMPSIDVPLMRPIARTILPIATSCASCPFRQPRPELVEGRMRGIPRGLVVRQAHHEGLAHPINCGPAEMAKFKSDFLNTLDERGFIHQCSDFAGLDALAAKGEVIAYVGYDCTAPSLHIGHLYTMMMLYWLQQTGGKPIALMGGGTTRRGGPPPPGETG